MSVSAWSAYVQTATDPDPGAGALSSSPFTAWSEVTVVASPETEWRVAGVSSWLPARLSALS